MGSFVKGWIWIWLFSNTLSLGLSLLWELASRTYRQPTKGYTAGKVIPKADLWTNPVTGQICTSRCSRKGIESWIRFNWRMRKKKEKKEGIESFPNIGNIISRCWEFSVEAPVQLSIRFYPFSPQFLSRYATKPVELLSSSSTACHYRSRDRDRPTVNALLKTYCLGTDLLLFLINSAARLSARAMHYIPLLFTLRSVVTYRTSFRPSFSFFLACIPGI